jgi:hypothetical protein
VVGRNGTTFAVFVSSASLILAIWFP